jgi:membrane-associated phospholipid phosphatase
MTAAATTAAAGLVSLLGLSSGLALLAGAANAKAPSRGAAAPRPPSQTSSELHFQPGVSCPSCELTAGYSSDHSGLHWQSHWQPVGVRELVTIGVMGGSALAVQLFWAPPTQAHWSTPLLFDDAVRDAMRLESASARRTASSVSDVLFALEIAHTAVIDPLLVAWWKHEAPFVAWQMVVIDAQAYSMTLLADQVVKRLTARARPWVTTNECAQNPSGPECGSGNANVSFYSGHTAMTATSAGLMCAHHTQLRLYRGDFFDAGICALAIAGTVATGALRIASDNHWATDVIVGHVMGYTSGYLLPTLLYYKQFRSPPDDHASNPQFAALPLVARDALGISVLGAF